MVFGCVLYLVASEYVTEEKSKGEVLVFQRHMQRKIRQTLDEESHGDGQVIEHVLLEKKSENSVDSSLKKPRAIQKQTAVVHWNRLNYDIKVKKEERRILQDVEGWVKPGTMSTLMV